MQRTRIKYCGITSVEDALAAADCGADAVGLVFCPSSPRHISIERAGDIVKALPLWVTPVGLFVDAAYGQVQATAEKVGLTNVQLHGHESVDDVARLSRLRVIRAVWVTANVAHELEVWRNTNVSAIHLETSATAPGGTGLENDWSAIEELRAREAFDGLPPLIVAGGLNPQNVADVVRRLRPYAVDVSSGIEQAKGIKSIEKMRAFTTAVRCADSHDV